MKEKDFQREIARSVPWAAQLLGQTIHYLKIPDAPQGPASKFAPRKGYDCFLVYRGRHIALELKMSKHTSVGFDALNDHQEDILSEVEAAGGLAFVVVNFRVTFSKTAAKARGQERAILAFAIPLKEWVHARETACRASIPLEALEAGAIALQKVRTEGGIGWDIRALLVGREERQALVVPPALQPPAPSGPEQLELAGVRV